MDPEASVYVTEEILLGRGGQGSDEAVDRWQDLFGATEGWRPPHDGVRVMDPKSAP